MDQMQIIQHDSVSNKIWCICSQVWSLNICSVFKIQNSFDYLCPFRKFFKNSGLQEDRIWSTGDNVLTPEIEDWESLRVHQIFVVAFEVSSVLGIHENIVFIFYERCHWSSVLCFTWITTETMLFRVQDIFIIT